MSDALQRMAVAVTPAVMVSACGLLALGLDNQAARMSGRLRELARELRELPAGSPRRPALAAQIRLFSRRHGLLAWALRCDYGSLLSFVLASALSLAQGHAPAFIAALLPLACFTAGVASLGAMAVLVIASLQLSRAALRIELAGIGLDEDAAAPDRPGPARAPGAAAAGGAATPGAAQGAASGDLRA